MWKLARHPYFSEHPLPMTSADLGLAVAARSRRGGTQGGTRGGGGGGGGRGHRSQVNKEAAQAARRQRVWDERFGEAFGDR